MVAVIWCDSSLSKGILVIMKKLSLSLSQTALVFVEDYCRTHTVEADEVVERALTLLRERELERAYAEASAEIYPAWDVTLMDGLE